MEIPENIKNQNKIKELAATKELVTALINLFSIYAEQAQTYLDKRIELYENNFSK